MANPLFNDLRDWIAQLGFGFSVDLPYCSAADMRDGIRTLETAAPGTPLSETERLALMENLRMVIIRTATAGRASEALRAQSRLRCWESLREASSEAADAYCFVLRLFEIEVPECLLKDEP